MREDSFFTEFGHFYEAKVSSLPHGGYSKIFFLDHFTPSFLDAHGGILKIFFLDHFLASYLGQKYYQAFYMTHKFDFEVSLHWLLWPTVVRFISSTMTKNQMTKTGVY